MSSKMALAAAAMPACANAGSDSSCSSHEKEDGEMKTSRVNMNNS